MKPIPIVAYRKILIGQETRGPARLSLKLRRKGAGIDCAGKKQGFRSSRNVIQQDALVSQLGENAMAEVHRQLVLRGFEEVLAETDTAAEQRRVRWAHEILSSEQDAVNYLHSGFCQAALPHREPKNPTEPWVRRNGAYQLVIRPGILPLRDRIVPVGVPYGTKARLIMIYFQTEAVRNRSQVVDLGPNMASWLKSMGLATSGGARGSYAPVREQALQDRALRVHDALRAQRQGGPAHRPAHRRRHASVAGARAGSWPAASGSATSSLSDAFFEHLMEHSVPLSEEAIARLKHSSLALDLYVWLTYRLHTLRRETIVPWHALARSFRKRERTPSACVPS